MKGLRVLDHMLSIWAYARDLGLNLFPDPPKLGPSLKWTWPNKKLLKKILINHGTSYVKLYQFFG